MLRALSAFFFVVQASLGMAWEPEAPGPGTFPVTEEQKVLFQEFLGDFSCFTDFPAIPGVQAEHKATGSMKISMDHSDMWLHMRYVEKRSESNTLPMSFDEFWAYNPRKKVIDRNFMGSFGDRGQYVSLDAPQFSTKKSISWKGTALINPLGVTLKVRDSSVVNEKGFQFSGEILLGPVWVHQYKVTCTRL